MNDVMPTGERGVGEYSGCMTNNDEGCMHNL